MAHDVFISYMPINKNIAATICSTLENMNIQCWIAPRDIMPGEKFASAITDAIHHSKIMVIILSADSSRSTNIVHEIDRAIADNLIIIPFKIEDIVPTNDMEYLLASAHWLDAISPPINDHIQTLANAIKGVLRHSIDVSDNLCAKSPGRFVKTPTKKNIHSNQDSNQSATQLSPDMVCFSALAPKKLERNSEQTIKIIMYEEKYRYQVDKTIQTLGKGATLELDTGYHEVEKNSKVKIELLSKDIAIENYVRESIWYGKYQCFYFQIHIPSEYERKTVSFTGKVYKDGLLLTIIEFTISIRSLKTQYIQGIHGKTLRGFISYASQDREKVVPRVQGIQKGNPFMDIFLDCEKLRSGQHWQDVLMTELDRSDILFLCWSKYAKESTWVNWEWQYVYKNKGIEAIEPMPLEMPDNCPPPPELEMLHFGDKLLIYEKSTL